MTALSAHLRKEFRDHRSGILGVAAMILGFGIVLCLACDNAFVATRLASALTVGALLTAVVLFAPDLAEQRQQTLRFLERLPTNLHAVFVSKVLFLASVIVGATMLAYCVATVLRGMFSGDGFDAILVDPDLTLGIVLSTTLAGAFWMMAMSCWLRRGLLAVPVTGLIIACVALPIYLDPTGSLPIVTLLWIHPPIALAAAWWSFTGGRRNGRGPLAAAWRGMSIAGLACTAMTALSLSRAAAWSDVSPERMIIGGATIGADGHYAFARARHRGHNWPSVWITIDLRTGSSTWAGDQREAYFGQLGDFGFLGSQFLNRTLITRTDSETKQLIDTRSLEVISETDPKLPFVAREDLCRATLRNESTLVLPDGRRLWKFDGEWLIDSENGCRTLLDKAATRDLGPTRKSGFGLLATGRRKTGRKFRFRFAYDPIRELQFEYPSDWNLVACMADGWLCGTRPRTPPVAEFDARWRIYDPIAKKTRPALGLLGDDDVFHVSATGSILVRRLCEIGASEKASFFRVDLASGTREALEITGAPWYVTRAQKMHHAMTTSRGREVFMSRAKTRLAVTSLLPGAAAFTPLVVGDSPLLRVCGTTSESDVVVLTHRGELNQLNLDTRKLERLFPRAQPAR